jgi:hypothetical protein
MPTKPEPDGCADSGAASRRLAAWGSIVAPANSILATWTPGPLPENFGSVQLRWETGHMIVTGLKLVGFSTLVLANLMQSYPRSRRPL